MEKFTSKKELLANFFEDNTEHFFVQQIGYHDFHHLAPKKVFHVQKFYTLHFILSGSGTLNIYGKEYHLNQYDMFIVPPAVQMSYYPDEENPWTYIWFEFRGNDAEYYCRKMEVEPGSPLVHCYQPHHAYSAISNIFSRLDRNAEVRYYLALSFFYQIMDTCLSKVFYSDMGLIEQAITYIHCHFHSPQLRVETVCHDLNASYDQLSKNFKQSQGISMRDFIIQTRMNEAKVLLRTSSLSVSEVAHSVGYTDNIHFMKSFKRYTGVTAIEYRNKKN